MSDYYSDMEEYRRQAYEDEYHAAMADEMQQQWLHEQLTEQTADAVHNNISNAYKEITDELSRRTAEISFLRSSNYSNLLAISCLVTIEKISRELVSLPVLTAILSRNGNDVHKGDYLVKFLDRDIQPMHFFYDFFQMSRDPAVAEASAIKVLAAATKILGEDGFFISKIGSSGPTKLFNWMDEFRKFRNQLMHGRKTATKEQAQFTLTYFQTWITLMDHAISKYGLRLTHDLVVIPEKTR